MNKPAKTQPGKEGDATCPKQAATDALLCNAPGTVQPLPDAETEIQRLREQLAAEKAAHAETRREGQELSRKINNAIAQLKP